MNDLDNGGFTDEFRVDDLVIDGIINMILSGDEEVAEKIKGGEMALLMFSQDESVQYLLDFIDTWLTE
ncbi:MAG: hypothetical protein ACYS6K_25080 [Planctomycetota bacterium]